MAWQVDYAHSTISFWARHMMISKVRGTFNKFSAEVSFDENNPENTTVSVEIDAGSIQTRNDQRDGHLKSPDFLNIAEYPNIIFKSKQVEQISDTRGKLIGDLTIRNITQEVTLDINYFGVSKSPWGTTSAGFAAEAVINRHDWGASWNQVLETGGVLVSDQVHIDIELELVRVAEMAAVPA